MRSICILSHCHKLLDQYVWVRTPRAELVWCRGGCACYVSVHKRAVHTKPNDSVNGGDGGGVDGVAGLCQPGRKPWHGGALARNTRGSRGVSQVQDRRKNPVKYVSTGLECTYICACMCVFRRVLQARRNFETRTSLRDYWRSDSAHNILIRFRLGFLSADASRRHGCEKVSTRMDLCPERQVCVISVAMWGMGNDVPWECAMRKVPMLPSIMAISSNDCSRTPGTVFGVQLCARIDRHFWSIVVKFCGNHATTIGEFSWFTLNAVDTIIWRSLFESVVCCESGYELRYWWINDFFSDWMKR